MFRNILQLSVQCAALLAVLLPPLALRAQVRPVQQRTANGVLEGVVSADGKVRTFKGIPFAAPPVGPLRWKPPQPVAAWTGVRKASEYGARCMQAPIYSDMIFHDSGPSEDCLYLNLWMPAARPSSACRLWSGSTAAGLPPVHLGAPPGRRQSFQRGVLVVTMKYSAGHLRIFFPCGTG